MTIVRLGKILVLCALVSVVATCGGGSIADARSALAQLAVAPASLSFGTVSLGSSSSTQVVSIHNTGNANLYIDSISADSSALILSPLQTPISLAPGQSVQLTVGFKPSSAGAVSSWLSIYSNSKFSPNRIAVSGTGTAATPHVSVSPSALSFGAQSVGTTSTAQALTVVNTGTVSATINAITVNNANFAVSVPALPITLAPSQALQAGVLFKPVASGTFNAQVSVVTSASTASVVVSGSAAASGSPLVTLGPPSGINFGTVQVGKTSATQALTLTNTGTADATVNAITSDNANFSLALPTLPLTLTPSQSVQVGVVFKPGSSGSFSGWLSVSSNAANSPSKLGTYGTGGTPPPGTISVNPIALSFSNQTLNVLSPIQVVTISNTGTSTVSISGLGVSPSQFTLVSAPTFPVSLAGGQKTNFSVAFTPTTASAVTGAVTITSNASPATTFVSLSGSGATTGGTLSVSPSSLNFLKVLLNSVSPVQSISLTNTGSSSVSLTGLSVSPASFILVSKPTLPMTLAGGQSTSISVSYSPTALSSVTGAVTIVSTASPANTSVSLTGSGDSGPSLSGLTLSTTSLHAGYLQQAYTATLSVTGGVGPYTWTVSSGQLPPGLTLNPATGQIAGTPAQAGQFSLGIQAIDSTKPSALGSAGSFDLTVASGVYDQYGGITAQTCSNGPAAHFYAQEINNRWWLCTPAGNAFWMRGVYDVDASDTSADYQGVTLGGTACTSSAPPSSSNPCSVVMRKYGDNATWGPQTVQRLRSWGFNSTGEFSSMYVQPTGTSSSWTTSDHSNPQKMAFSGLVWPSHYARNSNPYANPVKDIVGPTNASVYTGVRHASPDVFDPNFAKWLAGDLADYQNGEYAWIHSSHSDYLIGVNFDDTDELLGFGAGADFNTLSNGNEVADKWHPHLGWMVLVTPSIQSSGKDANGNAITYSDTTVYSKQAFSTFMSGRYAGNISLLNSAWGSTYSTFGSNGGWGSGTGLMDEAGTHAWVTKDPYKLAGSTPAMKADLDAFLLAFAQQYFSVIKAALNKAAPGVLYLGPTNLGGWGGPPRAQILQAAGQYLDVLAIASIPTGCLSCTSDQARIDFIAQNGGNKPWINWEGFFAQPDSYMSVYGPSETSFPQAATQLQRGQIFQTMVSQQLSAKDTATGTYHIVGYKWWEFYDCRGENDNWGLVTRRDNGYDGTATITGTALDSWGFKAGGEQQSYGNFLDSVTGANLGIYKTLLGLP